MSGLLVAPMMKTFFLLPIPSISCRYKSRRMSVIFEDPMMKKKLAPCRSEKKKGGGDTDKKKGSHSQDLVDDAVSGTGIARRAATRLGH